MRRLHRVEQRPEDLALALDGGNAALLVRSRARVLLDEAQAEGRVARRLPRPVAEVSEGVRVDPWVVPFERRDARGHDVAGEQLGQRRRHRDEQVRSLDEIHIGIAGAPHARQDVFEALDVLPLESHGLGEPEPQFESTLARRAAVVIVQALHPFAAERRIVGLREDHRVLAGDPRLVVVAIAHPGLDLGARERALVHARVERVLVVVARGSHRAQARLQLAGIPGRVAHSDSSSPSLAIPTPARVTSARSSERASRSGFELLRCV